jgi:hypothetical protein
MVERGRNSNRQGRLSDEKSGLLSAYDVAAANLTAVVVGCSLTKRSRRFDSLGSAIES